MNRIIFIILIGVLIIGNSCLHREFVEGRYEIKSSLDSALNDSSLIFGHVHHVDWPGKEVYYKGEFEIWIENSSLKTITDTTGYYSLKSKPGIYTLKCQSSGNEWDKLVEKVAVELQKNKKIEIDFYIGTTIE
jgi:hypothetical protein